MNFFYSKKLTDYWTVVKICESFPITLESCKKLLKSKWVPKTLDDLAKHDEKVIENWKKLTAIENTEPSNFLLKISIKNTLNTLL